MPNAPIRAIAFDAVGTLLFPEPSAAAAYHAVAVRHGSTLTLDQIRSRFGRAFSIEEQFDRDNHWQTSEARERQRWHSIVAGVLDDVRDLEACFEELFDYFRQPIAWRCLTGIGPVLTELQQRGFALAIGSNFDRRLHDVLRGVPELHSIEHVVISSEVGVRKPGTEFFLALAETVQAKPAEVLFVGDDAINDYQGATAAGMFALLIEPSGSIQTLSRQIDQHLSRLENASM